MAIKKNKYEEVLLNFDKNISKPKAPQPTIFDVNANQIAANNAPAIKEEPKTVETITPAPETIETKEDIAPEAVVSNETVDKVEEPTITESEETKPTDTAVEKTEVAASEETNETVEVAASKETVKEDIPVQEEEKSEPAKVEEPKKAKEPKPKKSPKNSEAAFEVPEKYIGNEGSISVMLSIELWEYLQLQALLSHTSVKKYFADLLVKELLTGTPDDEPELLAQYRKPQHDNQKKTISINKELHFDVKLASIEKYHMKHIAFMAYVLHKDKLHKEKEK